MTDQMLDNDRTTSDTIPANDQVEVRRNVVLSALVAGLAAVLTVAFALRAFGDGGPLDWALFAVLAAITALHAAAVADARAPLLVADRLGVRLREGAEWQGIAWEQIECLEHLPRRLPAHDGHLLVVGDDGQQLIVPLTLATRIVGAASGSISDELAALADGRADVVEVVPGLDEDVVEETGDEPVLDTADGASLVDQIPPAARALMLPADEAEDTVRVERHGIAAEVEKRFRFPFGRTTGTDADDADTVDTLDPVIADASTDEIEPVTDDVPPPAPGRPVVGPARVEVQRSGFARSSADGSTGSHPTIGANALAREPAGEPEQVEHTLTVVLDDLAVHPAAEPVIGPQLEGARSRLRLTVDQLSERTRIRPHVIEAIEVDDFGPCGGDFYARGHLRTLARVLGIEAGPIIASYDETYADAPVDPRRIFESELATGVGGSIRGTRGGRNWSVLVAAVMAAILVWSIARLVMDGPVDLGKPSQLNQSAGIGGPGADAKAVPVTLNAAGGGAQVIVRDGHGKEVFKGQLAFGQTSNLDVVPPVRIWTSDGSVTASVDCKDPAPLGETGQEASKSLPAC
jgi:cytoskeleton protein RodZ